MESKYFQTVADYINLNPSRAIMIGKGMKWESLKDYPWSSFPAYCGWILKRPSWLEVSKVFGTYSFKGNAVGRESYLNYLEAKGAQTGASYSKLMRGGCLGDGNFKQKMLDKVEGVLSSTRRESVSGSAKREHNEYEAGKMLLEGLAKLGIRHEDLASMSKSAVEKKSLAVWIGGNTLAPSKWITASLSMGHPSSVSQAKAWSRDSKDGKKWLGKLE